MAGGLALLAALRLAARKLYESFSESARAKAAARRKLEQAGSFAAWSAAARELDALSGLSQQERLARWRRETRLYDRRLLATRLRHLREVRERGDLEEMAFAVRADLLRNLANVTSPCASFLSSLLCFGWCAARKWKHAPRRAVVRRLQAWLGTV